MTRIIAIVAVVAVLAGLGGSYYYINHMRGGDDVFAQCRDGSDLTTGKADIGGPFTLVNGDGKTVTDKDVIDGPTLVYFGYTSCPDVCPVDNARNAEAVSLLEKRGKMVKPVFISVDPKRDTPEMMKEFTGYMHPRMVGLTGTPKQVKAAAKAYRVYYQAREPKPGEDYYQVDHSTFTYFMMPGRGFVDFFRRQATGEQVADKVACYMDAAKTH